MTSILTNYSGNAAWSALFPNLTGYLAAFVAPGPGVTGDLTTEVAGGGYARQLVKIAAPTNKGIVVVQSWTFPAMPACTVAWLGLCDTTGGGHVLALAQLGTPLAIAAGGALTGASGDVAFTL